MLKKLKDLFKGMSDREVVGLFFCTKKKKPKQQAVKSVRTPKTGKKSSSG